MVKVGTIEAIVAALEAAGVRYLVAGGLAVNAHGYLRLTNDVDLVVQLTPENARKAFAALASTGYQPLVPVRPEQFGDRAVREGWVRDKGMQVLSFWSDRHPETSVDLFVTEVFDFDEEYAAAHAAELSPGLVMRFVRLETLIRMKEAAGRPQDMDDIQHLRWIIEDRKS